LIDTFDAFVSADASADLSSAAEFTSVWEDKACMQLWSHLYSSDIYNFIYCL